MSWWLLLEVGTALLAAGAVIGSWVVPESLVEVSCSCVDAVKWRRGFAVDCALQACVWGGLFALLGEPELAAGASLLAASARYTLTIRGARLAHCVEGLVFAHVLGVVDCALSLLPGWVAGGVIGGSWGWAAVGAVWSMWAALVVVAPGLARVSAVVAARRGGR